MIKRILLLLVFLCFALPAHAATISVQSATLSGFNGSATATYQVWVFSDSPWTDVSGNPHGAGSPSDKVFTQIVTGLSFNNSTKVLTIPAFNLTSTTDALVNPNVRLYVWIFQVVGASATPVKPFPNTENGIKVPATIAAAFSCSSGSPPTCASLYDLIVYTQGAQPAPLPRFTYTDAQIDAKIGNASGVPTGRSISVTAPLTGGGDLSANRTIAIPKATSLVDGYLAAADFASFNSKQAAGSYITALTGDVTAGGPGSAAATLASVVSPGTNTKITYDAKGRITAGAQALFSDIGGTLSSGQDYTSGVSASTYRSVTVNTTGRVTGGSNPTTFSGYAISDTSANLASAITDETGTPGNLVFSNSPSLTTPSIAGGTLSGTFSGSPTITGNLTAPIYDKGGEVFDASSYASLQAAIDACAAAGGGIVYLRPGSYTISSTLNIGDGTSSAISSYHGVSLVGAGGPRLIATSTNQAVKITWAGATSTTTPMLKIKGPIGGVRIENVLFDCASTAGIGIQSIHAQGVLIKNCHIVNNTGVALDIDAYATTTFGGDTVFTNGSINGIVENLLVNSTNNNASGVRLGATGNVAQWNFNGGAWRLDGTTGSSVLILSFADHNSFYSIVGKAETGLRVKAITGQTTFPHNNFFWSSSIQSTSGANAYVIDNSVATWAPIASYGLGFLGLPTADGSTPPTDTRLWGFTDTQIFLGTWRFRDALTASSTLLVSGILSAGSGPTTLTNATGQLLAAAAASPTGSGNWVLATSPTITTPNIVGTATNNNASAGSVGEYVEATAAIGSVSLTSLTAKTITSISLTAGDWDVSVIGYFSPDGTTKVREVAVSLSSVNNTLNITPGRFTDDHKQDLTYSTAISHAIPKYRFSLSGTTTFYLVMYADFNTSTMTAGGYISARRVR